MITSLNTLRGQFNNYNLLRNPVLFGATTLLCLPALLFSRFMPAWTPLLALSGLAVLLALRWLAIGHLTILQLDGPLLVLLALLPFGLWTSLNPAVSRPLVFAFAANLAVFWAVAAQKWLRQHGWLVLLLGVAIGLILLLGTRFGSDKLPFINHKIYTRLPGGWRAFWDQERFNPNLSGGLLAMFLMPALARAVKAERWPERDAAKLVAVLLALLLLLTQSRGALLASLVGLAVMSSLSHRRWLHLWVFVAVGLLCAIIVVGPGTFFEAILGHSDLWGDSSLPARLELWQHASALIYHFPLTGVGLGMVEPAIKQFSRLLVLSPTANFGHAHNIYLQLSAEMGLPTLAAHLTIFGTLLAALRHKLVFDGSGLALGLLGSLVVFLTHGLVDAIIASPQVALIVWGLLGLMAAVAVDAPPQRNASVFPAWRPRARWQLLLGLLIGATACGWAGRGVAVGQVLQVLGGLTPGWLAAAVGGVIAVTLAKACRWRDLYPRPKPTPQRAFAALAAAQTVNLVIPLRLGELLRLGMMRRYRQPLAVTLPTILVEKTVDLLVAGLVAGVLIILLAVPLGLAWAAGGSLFIGGGLAAGLLALGYWSQPDWLPQPVSTFLQNTLATLATMWQPSALVTLCGWTTLIWLLSLLTMAALLAAFHINVPLAAVVCLMLLVSVSNVVPSPPALAGLMQGAAVAALVPFGVTKSTAFAVGIAVNIVTVLPLIVLGSLALMWFGWPLDREQR